MNSPNIPDRLTILVSTERKAAPLTGGLLARLRLRPGDSVTLDVEGLSWIELKAEAPEK